MNFEELLEKYQLQYITDEFIDFRTIPSISMPEWFYDELHFAVTHSGESDKEAFASEFIIVPFLRAIWRRHPNLEIFSHLAINADNITVIPDYLVAVKSPTGYKALSKPLLLTVEAKDEKFHDGWQQALQQALICQKINATTETPVFAIVTTGDLWEFGKLDGRMFYKHPFPVSIQHPDEVLGVLDTLFAACEQSAARLAAGNSLTVNN